MPDVTEKEHAVLQGVMNEAYERWQANKEWSHDEFRAQLSYREQVAVHFGNMNYQVENGGWSQWVFNAYGTLGVVEFLLKHAQERLEQNAATVALAQILRQVRDAIQEFENCENRAPSFDYEFQEDDPEEQMHMQIDEFSSPYYVISKEVLAAVETYLGTVEP